MLRRYLAENPHIAGCFWDFASVYQSPRTQEQTEAFHRALEVMADCYASAVGPTVLQLKETPPRPTDYDGALCLFGLHDGIDSEAIDAVVEPFGARYDQLIAGDPPPAVVRFRAHDAALAFIKDSGAWSKLCKGVGTLYNERPYDDRGWCTDPLSASCSPTLKPNSSLLAVSATHCAFAGAAWKAR